MRIAYFLSTEEYGPAELVGRPRPPPPCSSAGGPRWVSAPVEGDFVATRGRHYAVDKARIYTLPEEPPSICVSGFGAKSTDLAARIGDGVVGTSSAPDLVQRYKKATGGLPAQGGCKAAWAPTREEGVDLAWRLWPHAGLPGELARCCLRCALRSGAEGRARRRPRQHGTKDPAPPRPQPGIVSGEDA